MNGLWSGAAGSRSLLWYVGLHGFKILVHVPNSAASATMYYHNTLYYYYYYYYRIATATIVYDTIYDRIYILYTINTICNFLRVSTIYKSWYIDIRVVHQFWLVRSFVPILSIYYILYNYILYISLYIYLSLSFSLSIWILMCIFVRVWVCVLLS